jgi:plastocyanin
MKRFLLALMVLVSVIALVACNNNTPTNAEEDLYKDLVEVRFSTEFADFIDASMKALSDTVNITITDYKYTAVPNFTLQNPSSIYGIQSTQRSIGPDGEVTLGYFTQGNWHFHLYGYNSEGQMVTEGEVDWYLKKSQGSVENVIPITLILSTANKGSLRVIVATQAVSAGNQTLKVRVQHSGENTFTDQATYTASQGTFQNNILTWNQTIPNLTSGRYEVELQIFNNNVQIAGEALTVVVIDSAITTVAGQVYASSFVHGNFDVTVPGIIIGSVGENLQTAGLNVDRQFTWTSDTTQTTGVIDKYEWYIDGVLIETVNGIANKSWVHKFTTVGQYNVTCIARNNSGTEAGYSNVLVVVNP